MQTVCDLKEKIESGIYDNTLKKLYMAHAACLAPVKARYLGALDAFEEIFPGNREAVIYSAPGRTEVGGNHTDHQLGHVLAAAIDLDIIGIVSHNNENIIRIQSKGFPMNQVDLTDLSVIESEKGRSDSIVRGIAARFTEMGYKIGGLDIYTASDVLKGSGMSSSAAFEVLLGTAISQEFCGGEVDAVEIAKIGQYAENIYFGKASGLMDQMVSSVGSFVAIDFYDRESPVIEKIPFDFSQSGHSLCITDTKGNHADLTPDYVAVPTEMKALAAELGEEVLSRVEKSEFIKHIPKLRGTISDRAILRGLHFFTDDDNAVREAEALKHGDFETFKALVRASGNSSFKFLQNVYSSAHPEEQGVSLGLAVSEQILGCKGASRVHGGGFAGTIQAFVPSSLVDTYKRSMDELFGENSCYILNVRESGGIRVTD